MPCGPIAGADQISAPVSKRPLLAPVRIGSLMSCTVPVVGTGNGWFGVRAGVWVVGVSAAGCTPNREGVGVGGRALALIGFSVRGSQ